MEYKILIEYKLLKYVTTVYVMTYVLGKRLVPFLSAMLNPDVINDNNRILRPIVRIFYFTREYGQREQ